MHDFIVGLAILGALTWAYVQGKQVIQWIRLGVSEGKVAELKVEQSKIQESIDSINRTLADIPAKEAAKTPEEINATFEKNMEGH